MNIFSYFTEVIDGMIRDLEAEGALPRGLDLSAVTVEPPRDASHGDIATNAAMVLTRQAGMKPRDIADLLAARLNGHGHVEACEVAGPGFINIRCRTSVWYGIVSTILREGTAFGDSTLGKDAAVNVEYVSANPTGPMHVGHARGAVTGDALANLLEKAGYDVTREYYINDAGAQIDVLARAVYHRYLEALGDDVGEVPEGLYPGDYLIPVGEKLARADGDKWRGRPEADWLEHFRMVASAAMMDQIRDDLAAMNIRHDVFSSERVLHESGAIDKAIGHLSERGLVYTGTLEPPKGKPVDDWEPRPQLLFRSSDFGDDTDRPLKKSDGSWTYFAADLAYHYDKYCRGFKTLIDVWGADHGGYVKRVAAGVTALTEGDAELDVKLCQLVKLFRNGEPVRMSKRAGQFVTLRDLVDEVGSDVVRFIMLTRKNDAPLDFDFAKVTEQSRDNPVFYVQYAHARICSVFRNAARDHADLDLDEHSLSMADFTTLATDDEVALIRMAATWPRVVETAARAHEPHRIAFYLFDLASQLHGIWNKGKDDTSLRFLVADDAALTRARLGMLAAVRTVLASGLGIMGVDPVKEMH